MKGETTVDQRIVERLNTLERVRKFYSERFHSLDEQDLIAALIEDAAYLALYHGIDFETLVKNCTEDVRNYYPDIP